MFHTIALKSPGMPGTQAGSRGSLAPGPHTTRHAGPHRAVPGTSRPVGRQAGATQITPVEKGQAMTRHRITHPDVRCSTSTWGTIPSSRSLPENSVLGPRASHFFAWQRRRSRRCWFYRRCSQAEKGPVEARSISPTGSKVRSFIARWQLL